VVANLLCSVVLMGPLRHAGLALATALAGMLNAATLVVVLNRRLGGVEWSSVGRSAGRVIIAALPLALACLWVANLEVWSREGQWMAKTVMLGVGLGLSATGYLGVHALMRSPELDVLWSMIRRRLGKK
jgi:putative peptidoglycan lipid II flippase